MEIICINMARIRNYSIKLLRNSKIQSRLMFSFILLSFIPLAFTGIFSYNKSSNAINSKVQIYSTEVMQQLQMNIRGKMEKLEYASDEVYLSKIIQDNAQPYDTMDDQTIITAMSDVNEYLKMKFSIIPDVLVTEIYDNPGNTFNGVTVVESDNSNNFNQKLKESLPRLRDIAALHKGAALWMLQDFKDINNSLLLIRTINSVISGRPIGTLVIGLKNSYLSDVFKDMNMGNGSKVFIVNSDGKIISSVNRDISIGSYFKNSSLAPAISENEKMKRFYFSMEYENSSYMMTYSKIINTDWYIISMVPYAYLNVENRNIGFYILIITVIASFFSILFTYTISRSISHPLKNLVKGINRTKGGDFSVFVKDNNNDEIAEVTHNFNNMVKEMSVLLDKIKFKEKQKRNAELKALQAQINPHFLSNTLNTVRWLAQVQKADNIKDLVTSLIQLLHVSMGKGEDMITVREEVEYLKNYINIQKYRFNDGFDVELDIEEKILDCMIFKFLLQPIVENSLIHGIEPKNGRGFIKVKAYKDGDNIRFIVTDDGVGISEDKLNEILNNPDNTDRKRYNGIGIKNVDERIKLFYSEQYGITITSIPNMFTTVEVIIPIV